MGNNGAAPRRPPFIFIYEPVCSVSCTFAEDSTGLDSESGDTPSYRRLNVDASTVLTDQRLLQFVSASQKNPHQSWTRTRDLPDVSGRSNRLSLAVRVDEVLDRLVALERLQISLALARFCRCFIRLGIRNRHGPQVSSSLDSSGVVQIEPCLKVPRIANVEPAVLFVSQNVYEIHYMPGHTKIKRDDAVKLVGLIVQNAEPLASVLLWRRKVPVGHHEAGISCRTWPIGKFGRPCTKATDQYSTIQGFQTPF